MNKEELIGKLQMVYIGDINALNEMIGYYDGLKEVIEIVQKENNQLKEQKKELRSWLEEETKEPISYNLLYDGKQKAYQEVISKLNELEGIKDDSNV